MNNPVLNNYLSRLIYTSIWILFACIQMLVLYWYSSWNWPLIVLDSSVFNVLLAGAVMALWYPVRFNRIALNGWLFIAFHLLLATIIIFCWLGAGTLLMGLFTSQDPDYHHFILSTIPLRAITGIFIYVVSVLVYYLLIYISELKKKVEAESEVAAGGEILSRVAVKRRQEIRVIPVNEIIYLEADGDYVHLYTGNDNFLKEKTMKYWENHLPAHLFVRIHRSYIVNVEYIARIEIYEKENYHIHLKNGSFLKASSAGYKLLRQTVQI